MIKSMASIVVVFVSLAFSYSTYAQCEDAEYVVNVDVDVGLWDAMWNGGYVEAAYEELGDDLASRSYLDNANVIYVNFVYTVHFWFWSGTGVSANICMVREETETWNDVANGMVNTPDVTEVDQTSYSSEGGEGDGADDDFWSENEEGDIQDWLDQIDGDDLLPDDWYVEIEDFVDDYYTEEEWEEEM